jgi:hypothetical protein
MSATTATFFPYGGLPLKVDRVDTLLPVTMADVHSLLVQLGDSENE